MPNRGSINADRACPIGLARRPSVRRSTASSGPAVHVLRASGDTLTGGFTKPIDHERFRAAFEAVIPTTPMGELERIKSLPGTIDAAADTLHKVCGPASIHRRRQPIFRCSPQWPRFPDRHDARARYRGRSHGTCGPCAGCRWIHGNRGSY